MQPGDKPFLDPDTTPGDVGGEDPADHPPTPDAKGEAPLVPIDGGAIDEGIIDGSPADQVIDGLPTIGELGGAA